MLEVKVVNKTRKRKREKKEKEKFSEKLLQLGTTWVSIWVLQRKYPDCDNDVILSFFFFISFFYTFYQKIIYFLEI